jgi:hypothetical protein
MDLILPKNVCFDPIIAKGQPLLIEMHYINEYKYTILHIV